MDTRNANGPLEGPKLSANTTRTFVIINSCGVPNTAKAVTFNVTIAEPTDGGDRRIFPADASLPLASVINWIVTDAAVANGAIIPLGAASGDIKVLRWSRAASARSTSSST